MKKILLYLTLAVSLVSGNRLLAQTSDTTFTAAQVRRIAFTIDSLTKEVERLTELNITNNQILQKKDNSIDTISRIALQREVIIGKQTEQITLLQNSLQACEQARDKIKFGKFSKTWFTLGITVGAATILLVK